MKTSVKVLLAVVLLIVNLLAFGMLYVNAKLNLIDYVEPGEKWYNASGSDVAQSGMNEPLVMPTEDIFQDKNVINILLLGTDERFKELHENARADSMMVLSLNKKANTVKLVSLERGMNIKMPNGKGDVLTNAFRYGGPDWVIYCVRSHLKLDVEKYVRVNFTVFEKIIDAMGGVDIELTKLEASALNGFVETNTFPLDRLVSAGMEHLDGFEALQYCRLRYIDSDWQRIVRQRKTIAAIKDQVSDMSLGELDNLANTILPLVQTNLDKSDIVSLMFHLPKFLKSDIEDMTIPAEGTFEFLSAIDYDANAKILQEFFYGES